MTDTVILRRQSSVVIVNKNPSQVVLPGNSLPSILVNSSLAPSVVIKRDGVPGSQGVQGTQGIQGIQGTPGSQGSRYTHIQSQASSSWMVIHNLGVQPNVQVSDSNNEVVNTEIKHLDISTCLITFNVPMLGSAQLN